MTFLLIILTMVLFQLVILVALIITHLFTNYFQEVFVLEELASFLIRQKQIDVSPQTL